MTARPAEPARSPAMPPNAVLRRAAAAVLTGEGDRRRQAQSARQFDASGLTDYLLTDAPARADPDAALALLRWGGQVVFASRASVVERVAARFRGRPEFVIEREPTPLPGFDVRAAWGGRPRVLAIRKVLLDRPSCLASRQSFDVRLVPDAGASERWCVSKRVPGIEQTVQRLEQLLPGRSDQHVYHLARKLSNKVFPVLLTRELGFLTRLQETLPHDMIGRVPRPIRVMRDEHGRVHRLDMTWLREGGDPISPTTFARQAAALLDAVHQHAGIVHLDLRLDNMVVTDQGVGFVDFGSACLIGEPLEDRPMLRALFSSMLSASRIRRDLRRLQRKRLVTSALFEDCYPRREPAIDLFALALQMTRPWAHPPFKGLVSERGTEQQIERLTRLQRHVLRPKRPDQPEITDAAQIVAALSGSRITDRSTAPAAPTAPARLMRSSAPARVNAPA